MNLRKATATGLADASAHYDLACLLAQKGEKEAAFLELAEAAKKGYANRSVIDRDPDLDPLRADPRFANVIAGTPRPCLDPPATGV